MIKVKMRKFNVEVYINEELQMDEKVEASMPHVAAVRSLRKAHREYRQYNKRIPTVWSVKLTRAKNDE